MVLVVVVFENSCEKDIAEDILVEVQFEKIMLCGKVNLKEIEKVHLKPVEMEPNPESAKLRHDWYQTESHVFINILSKNVNAEDCKVNYEPNSVSVTFIQNEVKQDRTFQLLHEINTSECSHKVTPSKIEIKLKKNEGIRWEKLENDGSVDKTVKQAMAKTPGYPSSSLKPKDWDKVVVDLTKNDDDNLEGDGALNALFQKIYSEGSDEVRKAMNKSFVESAGTVLSTNWREVKKEKVTMKPPDGMEFKKWDS